MPMAVHLTQRGLPGIHFFERFGMRRSEIPSVQQLMRLSVSLQGETNLPLSEPYKDINGPSQTPERANGG